MVHSSLEEHLHTHCPNCGQEHDAQFLSHFTDHLHYVVGDCSSCGYRIEIAKHDLGGGLFAPDGSVTTINEVFKKQHTEHVRDQVMGKENSPTIIPSFSTVQMRTIELKPKKDEKK